jgi:protein-serine/threonine kinase
LIQRLLRSKEHRVCSRRYIANDAVTLSHSQHGPVNFSYNHRLRNGSSTAASTALLSGSLPVPRDHAGRCVYPNDAEDIRSHRWFRGVDFSSLHLQQPPFVPKVTSPADTRYFDEDEPFSDWSSTEGSSCGDVGPAGAGDGALSGTATSTTAAAGAPSTIAPLAAATAAATAAEQEAALWGFDEAVRKLALQYVETPYDTQRLRRIEQHIEALPVEEEGKAELRAFVKRYGRREKKRPRDLLLRDPVTRDVALEVRKQTAFLGYTWRRIRRDGEGEGA